LKKKFTDIKNFIKIDEIEIFKRNYLNLKKIRFNSEKNYKTNLNYKPNGLYEYIKISEGCNKKCSFCIIPQIKGIYISKEIDKILEQCNFFLQNGVKELIFVSQDTGMYGRDFGRKDDLTTLIKKAASFDYDYRLRIMYFNPDVLEKKIIKLISDSEKICNYIDMPIQHTEDKILKKMNRNYSRKNIIEKVKFIRAYNPDIALRSVVITGHPGESENDFQNMLKTLQLLKFDKLSAFSYCDEKGSISQKFAAIEKNNGDATNNK